MKVKTEIKIYEINEERVDKRQLLIQNYSGNSDYIYVIIGDKCYTLLGKELIKAASNAIGF